MHDADKVVKGLSVEPRRIAVIGRAGSGKTTLARTLGTSLGLDVVHLDRLAWGPGWQPVAPGPFAARHAELIARERWVLDGGYRTFPGWAERIARADLVVLVEAPLPVCVWRIARRALQPRLARRPDLPEGCAEQLSRGFLRWTLTWQRRNGDLPEEIRRLAPGVPLVRVRDAGRGARLWRRAWRRWRGRSRRSPPRTG